MERTKMPREDRAKQFAPYDALKGLSKALRMKEYEHEKVAKGDLDEETIMRLSNIISNLNKNDIIKVKYYLDGHYLTIQGKAIVEIEMQRLKLANKVIDFDDIKNIEIVDR